MSGFVLDNSIASAWFLEDEITPEIDGLMERTRDEGAVVPFLWHLEFGNVLLKAEKHGRITREKVAEWIDEISILPIETDVETTKHALRSILNFARVHNLTTYDAAYLELAARRGIPLATKDKNLRAAAARVGLEILPERLPA